MGGTADHSGVRLAELVAALSLGVDLGFGQPMEHVLRQCLIALRLAERIGLDEESRAVVYYTALLVSVGCHTDAHEQAKWFGDDIALKSIKYEHGPGRRAVAASMRMIGSGNPPLHRFRIGLEFALSGRREVDDMINHEAHKLDAIEGNTLVLREVELLRAHLRTASREPARTPPDSSPAMRSRVGRSTPQGTNPAPILD
jgi:hypothetical protein